MATFRTLKDNPREIAPARSAATTPTPKRGCGVRCAPGLVVELDGGQHSEQVAYDARRTAYLEGLGLQVLRFWNSDVLTNRDGVCLTILDACGGAHPSMGPG